MKCWVTKSGIKINRVLWGRCNCFLIEKNKNFLLVDTGRKKNWKNLVRAIKGLGVQKGLSVPLVLTHCHFDHAENAAEFTKTYKSPVIVHKSEAGYLKNGENPVIGGTLFLTRALFNIISAEKLLSRFGYEPVDYDFLVDDTFRLEPLGFPGYVLHTPGHTAGSISVVIDDEIAMVGDAMFGVFRGSVFPPFADDIRLMIESWRKLLDTGCRLYLPAHGSERSRDLLLHQYHKHRTIVQPSG